MPDARRFPRALPSAHRLPPRSCRFRLARVRAPQRSPTTAARMAAPDLTPDASRCPPPPLYRSCSVRPRLSRSCRPRSSPPRAPRPPSSVSVQRRRPPRRPRLLPASHAPSAPERFMRSACLTNRDAAVTCSTSPLEPCQGVETVARRLRAPADPLFHQPLHRRKEILEVPFAPSEADTAVASFGCALIEDAHLVVHCRTGTSCPSASPVPRWSLILPRDPHPLPVHVQHP